MKKLDLITNKLLSRQVKRVFAQDAELSDDFIKLLKMINQSYEHYERDRRLIERAMEVSSEELRNSHKNLAEQNEELELFVSKVSHDLKAPIRTINSFAQLIGRELKKSGGDEKILDYLSFITNGAQNMHLLIENLLFHARLGLKLELEDRIDLNELIPVVKNNLGGLIQENRATIIIEDLPVVYGRSHEVLQLFQNLMGNAIKFKKKEVDPIVKIICNEKESEYIISIEDNGIGIENKDKANIFGAFQRLNGASDYEGTGLGLSICKKIIDNIGGRIWVESEYGKGTIFVFSLPKSSKTESTIKNSNVNVNNQVSSQANV
ncbi:MAG: ATP-binding protein [Saprospiraceae bacterium]